MRIKPEQFDVFVRAMEKKLAASIRIEKVDALNFRCIVSLHNPMDSDFDFFHLVQETNLCNFLVPFNQEGNPLQEVSKLMGGEWVFVSNRRPAVPFLKDWQNIKIAPFGIHYFEIPVRREEKGMGEQQGKLLRIGKKRLFLIGEETKIDMRFGYYGLTSEFVPLPLEP